MEKRKLIEFLERRFAVTTARKARKTLKELPRDPTVLFAGLGHQKLSKLRAFVENRLPRAI